MAAGRVGGVKLASWKGLETPVGDFFFPSWAGLFSSALGNIVMHHPESFTNRVITVTQQVDILFPLSGADFNDLDGGFKPDPTASSSSAPLLHIK